MRHRRSFLKITNYTINEHSWINDTWLAPYCGYIVKLIEYGKTGPKRLLLDGSIYDVSGNFNAPNDWKYQIKKLLSPVCLDFNK